MERDVTMGEQIKSVGRRLWHERDKGTGQTVVRKCFNAKKRDGAGERNGDRNERIEWYKNHKVKE